jgi:hypothetical protein
MAFSKPLALREYELRCHADRGRHHFGNHTKIAKDFPYHQDTRKSATLSIAFLQYSIFVIEKMRPATGFSRRSEPAHPHRNRLLMLQRGRTSFIGVSSLARKEGLARRSGFRMAKCYHGGGVVA